MTDEDLIALRTHLRDADPLTGVNIAGFLCSHGELLSVADAAAGADSSIGGSVNHLREAAMAAGWDGNGALVSWLRSLALPAPVMLTHVERRALAVMVRSEMTRHPDWRELPTPALSSLATKLTEASRS